jgi:hypothetical protein
MADSYTPLIRLAMQQPLANINQWGTIFNAAVLDLIDEALAGIVFIDVTAGNATLQALNGSPDSARAMMLQIEGAPGGVTTITVPTLSKIYFVVNATAPAQPVNFKTALSNTLTILPSQTPAVIYVDAANNRVRAIGRANGIVPMTDWVNFPITFQLRTAGDTGVTIKYAKQGSFVTLYIPTFSTTLSAAGMGFSPNAPAIILPDNGSDQMTMPPSFISGTGVPAGAVPCFFINAAAGTNWGITNVGTAALVGGVYTSRGNLTYVYSTRSL